MNKWINGWMEDGCMNEWMNGQMNEWMKEYMNEQINKWVKNSSLYGILLCPFLSQNVHLSVTPRSTCYYQWAVGVGLAPWEIIIIEEVTIVFLKSDKKSVLWHCHH